jgi:hypothetical protein
VVRKTRSPSIFAALAGNFSTRIRNDGNLARYAAHHAP